MLESIVDLYEHIFLYLSSVMDWITEKKYRRMLDSFNENLSKRFSDEIAQISHKAKMLRRRAEYSSRAEVRSTRLGYEELRKDMRVGLDGIDRYFAEIQHSEERISRELREDRRHRDEFEARLMKLAGPVKHLLTMRALDSMQSSRTVYIPLQLADIGEQDVNNTSSAIGTYGYQTRLL